ncbi:MAG TPA: cytochrome c3 family protein [Pyrinomonadaceae bacterium]
MKLFLVVIAAFSSAALLVADAKPTGVSWSAPIAATTADSKVQPKQVTLAKDSQSDKYGEVAFNHETHSTKNYSPDGKSVITCVFCHHTDQPKADLKPPLVTSERNVVLTTAALNAADAAPVKNCRTCHLQAGDDSKPLPTIADAAQKTVKLNNEIAYHLNCNICHDQSIKVRPELKGKIPGTNDCAVCHKPLE